PITVSPNSTVEEVISMILKYDIEGFPVVENKKLVGFISIMDILLKDPKEKIEKFMKREVFTAKEDSKVSEITRLMLRKGISKVPIVDEDGNFIGIITHRDILRCYVERTTMEKVMKIKEILEQIHNCKISIKEEFVDVNTLIPTQQEIDEDELEARIYEIKNSLAEPIAVLRTKNKNLLIDGHTRAVAAKKLNIEKLQSYVLIPNIEIDFGLEKIPEKLNLRSVDDIKILK
ncbi:MAG: CBS domain-containing protein, partial [Candidatus Altarchaeaceae archaeon]